MNFSKQTCIEVITTGGTIDKSYDEQDGTFANRESMIRQHLLRDLRLPYTELKFHSLFSKDSLDISDDDRAALVRLCTLLAENRNPIIIIHGTDTLCDSAAFLLKALGSPKVPIIFTGAMLPAGFVRSDALQNLTESILCARLLAPWIYVCFHSTVHKVPQVVKDRVRSTFKTLD